jgi:hypothetical protein
VTTVSHEISYETARDSSYKYLQFPYCDPLQYPSCLDRIEIDPTFSDTAVYGTARPSTHKDSSATLRVIDHL